MILFIYYLFGIFSALKIINSISDITIIDSQECQIKSRPTASIEIAVLPASIVYHFNESITEINNFSIITCKIIINAPQYDPISITLTATVINIYQCITFYNIFTYKIHVSKHRFNVRKLCKLRKQQRILYISAKYPCKDVY
ncbi:hypothetical protein HZS_4969 [Henneguya salminicola]|nr:hypothetical protein HZS_4969 [Henneguya salminicola]